VTLQVSASPARGGARIRLSGELDSETSELAHEALRALGLRSGQCLTLDLGGVTFFDSSGIAVLLVADRMTTAAGIDLELTAVPEHVLKVLDVAGLTAVFTITPAVPAEITTPTHDLADRGQGGLVVPQPRGGGQCPPSPRP
jgi:anti-sigma B factor antagonist